MSDEHGVGGRGEVRENCLETPPSTPLSLNPTLSSQTSTERSKYKRKFNQNLLATPPSRGPGSPFSTAQPFPNFLTTADDELSSPTKRPPPPPPPPLPQPTARQAQPETTQDGQSPFPPIQAPIDDLPTSTRPQQPLIPQPQAPVSMSYARSYQYGNTTYYATETYQISSTSTSVPSTTSPAYGGEAVHRAPVGINPSPPVSMKPTSGPHFTTPREPTIAELPPEAAPAPSESTPQKSDGKKDSKQNGRHGFKRFFHRRKG